MSNDALYEQQLEESGSYRAAMEKVLIRSFYDNQEDLHDFLFSIYYSFVPVTRFVDRLPRELYELYLEKVYLHERRVRAIIDIADPQDGETALDLACDIGAIGHFLSNQGLAVLGLDLDWGPLKRCNSLWPTETRPMPIVQGNGRHLPYRVDSFDLVVAADFYEHIDTDWSSPTTLCPPGGESFTDVVARVHAAIDRIEGPELLVVAHAGPIRAATHPLAAVGVVPQRAHQLPTVAAIVRTE